MKVAARKFSDTPLRLALARCGEQTPPRQLEAVPDAAFCLSCREEIEYASTL